MGTWKRRSQLPEHRPLVGGVVWRSQANAWSSEKEQRIEIVSEESHQVPPGPALPNSVYSEGSFPGKIRQLLRRLHCHPTLQLCRHDLIGDFPPCFSQFSVLLSPSCG